jgi:hypothetical protein
MASFLFRPIALSLDFVTVFTSSNWRPVIATPLVGLTIPIIGGHNELDYNVTTILNFSPIKLGPAKSNRASTATTSHHQKFDS